jgi:hypothetical protein
MKSRSSNAGAEVNTDPRLKLVLLVEVLALVPLMVLALLPLMELALLPVMLDVRL